MSEWESWGLARAALEGFPEIAFGNAVGGIAAQTTFIVAADLMHRGANLEHAAASEENLLQGVLLVARCSRCRCSRSPGPR